MSFFHANQRDALNQSLAELGGQFNVSFEFFPPRNKEMEDTLWKSIDRLSSLKPTFFRLLMVLILVNEIVHTVLSKQLRSVRASKLLLT